MIGFCKPYFYCPSLITDLLVISLATSKKSWDDPVSRLRGH
ncbi:unnamed protein product, partial [Amoebophrya sp. A25]|eukprot:GSA25T00027938001.1